MALKIPENTLPVRDVEESDYIRVVSADGKSYRGMNLLPQKANNDGDYPMLTAGVAEQLASATKINNKVPYVSRITAGGADAGNRLWMDKLIGGTVAWNQLVQNGNFASTSNWAAYNSNNATFSVSSNTASMTYLSGGYNYNYGLRQVLSKATIAGHKYYICSRIKVPRTGLWGYDFDGNFTGKQKNIQTTDWTDFAIIANASTGGKTNFIIEPNQTAAVQTDDVFQVKNVCLFDLTQMFGSTIADYIYTLESGTAGAGVAKLREWGFCTADYYAYDAGSLQSVNASKHTTKDADDNILGDYTLDSSITLRGIPKLDASNNLYYDGDEYAYTGTVTRKYGVVDLGTLTWNYDSNETRFYATAPSDSATAVSSGIVNAVCGKYWNATGKQVAFNNAQIDKCFLLKSSYINSSRIYVRDSSYTDKNTFATAMSGVYLVYELASSTTESATGFTQEQLVVGGGMETFTDYAYSQGTRDVEIPVGHDSDYNKDLTGGLERVIEQVPVAPTSNGTYTLKCTVSGGTPSYSWVSG